MHVQRPEPLMYWLPLQKALGWSNSTIKVCQFSFKSHFLSPSGYAGPPRNFEYTYYPNSKSYALYWEQPIAKDGHWVTKYILEEWKEDNNFWVKRRNITTLQVTIKNIETTTKYRVCAANEIGYKETSCSKPIQLGKFGTVTRINSFSEFTVFQVWVACK